MDETKITHARRQAGRVVYTAEDPFPAPRPFERAALRARRAPRRIFSRRPSRRRLTARALCMVAAVALVVVAITGVLIVASTLQADLAASANAPATARSTPRSAWREGEVPFLYQTDAEWANAAYAGGTVAENGCGPTCLSMVYVALTGKTDRDPAAMCSFSQNGGYVVEGETSWELMTDGARQIGLRSHEVPADATAITAELEAGHPLIASVRPGDFTATGHFIVIAGTDGAGNLTIHDPNSPERSAQSWPVARVIPQCANLWAFEA
ncbi:MULTISPECIES: C39 family peptidase [unclassified Adlercreutzia]|uniref:C39 family peptidase n=1 Tax=unclassified Adlercreutzia TaxID=2636013 RepID=UPI001F150DC0|nr:MULTISPECIES: C39 family peptidase [unclassified Adlercreutzia]